MNQWPQVTFFSGGTEAPDETAQGEWLNLVAKAGFSYLMANVKYLRDGGYDLERIEEAAAQDGVSMTMLRVRPVRPRKSPDAVASDDVVGRGGVGFTRTDRPDAQHGHRRRPAPPLPRCARDR